MQDAILRYGRLKICATPSSLRFMVLFQILNVFLRFVFSAEVNLDHLLVVLHFVHTPFAQNAALVKHRDLARNLADESHRVR